MFINTSVINLLTTKQPVNLKTPAECHLEQTNIILVVGYIIVIIVGVIGNGLVLMIFHLKWKSGPTIELLILYLAVFDLLASIFGPFAFLYWILTCFRKWHFGTIGCKILPPLCRVFTDISIAIILIMALDRCRAIVFPLRRRFHRKEIHFAVFTMVFLSVVSELYYMNSLYLNSDGHCTLVAVNKPSYAYPLIVLTFVRNAIFLIVFVSTTILVYMRLNSSRKTKILKTSYKQANKRSKAVMKMLVVMATVFSLSVIPRDVLHLTYTISWLSGENGIEHTQVLKHWNNALRLLQISNSIYNVFIYGKMHGNFWRGVKSVFTCQPKLLLQNKNTYRSSHVLSEREFLHKTREADTDFTVL